MTGTRLGNLRAHLCAAATEVPGAAPAEKDAASKKAPPVLLSDAALKEYIKTGFVLIPPDAHGMPPLAVHAENWTDAVSLFEEVADGVRSVGDNCFSSIPGLRDVLESPAVTGVLQSVLGEGFTYHPHHFMHMTSPSTDQFWVSTHTQRAAACAVREHF